jgi:LacI family transcriptional regulator
LLCYSGTGSNLELVPEWYGGQGMRRGKAATIRDVAERAGVGVGTVSRVINNSPTVTAATRQRVQKTIAKLNYSPNPQARHLSLGKTMKVAVIAPFFTRPAFVERLCGIEGVLADTAYDLIVYNVETAEKRDFYFREVPQRKRADGVVILSLSPRPEDVERLAQSEVPVVLVDVNAPALTGYNRVVVNDVAGGQKAVQHLLDLGHRRIAYLSDFLDGPFNFTSSRDRLTGYRQALKLAGLPFRSDYHSQGAHNRSEAHRLACQLLTLAERPTAIFAASDTQAIGVLEAARSLALRVPEDLSVMGYDDIELAEYLQLTTVRQGLSESGKRGAELLLRVLAQRPDVPVQETMVPELAVRRTTAPPPSG